MAALLLVIDADQPKPPGEGMVGIRCINDDLYFNARGKKPYLSGCEAIIFQKQLNDKKLVFNEVWKITP